MQLLSVLLQRLLPTRRDRLFSLITAAIFLIFYSSGAILLPDAMAKGCEAPLCRVTAVEDLFVDDIPYASFAEAAENQLQWLSMQPPQKMVAFGEGSVYCSHIAKTIETLRNYLQKKPTRLQLNRYITTHYDIYQAQGFATHNSGEMLVTAYYEPTFAGSRKPDKQARWPIYRLPAAADSTILPTRAEIENNALLAGLELAWLNDPFDAYLLHIQGSGKIRFADGTIQTVRYAGNNGQPYMSLGKLFVDRGIMPLEEVNNISIRRWLATHKKQRRQMLQHNPRFIFFRWGDTQNPAGSNGVPLTPGRSVAIDPAILPTGSIAFLQSRQPLITGSTNENQAIQWQPLHRFVFPQDSGAAIKGPGRVDLFVGAGERAKYAANIMREPGKLYFLLLKGTPIKPAKCCQ